MGGELRSVDSFQHSRGDLTSKLIEVLENIMEILKAPAGESSLQLLRTAPSMADLSLFTVRCSLYVFRDDSYTLVYCC